jgi:hypothetical protein
MKRTAAQCLFLALILVSFYSCKKEYSYEGGAPSAGYLVRGSGNDCSLITIEGNYIVGHQLTDSNFLQVQVHVTRPGRYSVTSDQVNGYSFSSSGIFKDTGFVALKLAADGNPVSVGTNLLTLTYDSSTCQAQIVVLDGLVNVVQTSNPDYFPLGDADRWVYDDLSYPGDSVIRTLAGDTMINGITYRVVNEYISFFPVTNKIDYRKAGAAYLEHAPVSIYTDVLDYAPTIYDDLPILKEGTHTGDTWYSTTFTGRITVGIDEKLLRYLFTCIDADATVVLNGRTFLHVIKVAMSPEVADPGQNLVATGEIHTSYYAKGVGLIYRESFNGILTHPELQIRSWVVN